MFITDRGFARILKEAYNGPGLLVGQIGENMVLAGAYWAIEVKYSEISKVKKAEIMKQIGDFPETGEYFKANKNMTKYDLGWNYVYNVMDNARKCTMEIEQTNIILVSKNGRQRRVFQEATGGIKMIDETMLGMITNSAVNKEQGHTGYATPKVGKNGVYWESNIMALYVASFKDEEQIPLIRALEGVEINGIQNVS